MRHSTAFPSFQLTSIQGKDILNWDAEGRDLQTSQWISLTFSADKNRNLGLGIFTSQSTMKSFSLNSRGNEALCDKVILFLYFILILDIFRIVSCSTTTVPCWYYYTCLLSVLRQEIRLRISFFLFNSCRLLFPLDIDGKNPSH